MVFYRWSAVSNQPSISHRFWDMTSYRLKTWFLNIPTIVRPQIKFHKVTLWIFGRFWNPK